MDTEVLNLTSPRPARGVSLHAEILRLEVWDGSGKPKIYWNPWRFCLGVLDYSNQEGFLGSRCTVMTTHLTPSCLHST